MTSRLPDCILANIFSCISVVERFCTLSTVCKRWYDVVHSSTIWRKVDFNFQPRITLDILEKYIYPGSREIMLSECCFLEWEKLCSILRRCKKIDVFIVAWISYSRRIIVPDFTQTLNMSAIYDFQN